jgi:WD40 repeat protein
MLVTVSTDTTARVWAVGSGRCVHVLSGAHTQQVPALAISPSGHMLATVCADGTIR